MLTLIFLFFLGLTVGSFLNVLIDRIPKGQSIFGRSCCDHCRKTLSWLELIPILSFLIQKGRCRSCHQKIAWQNPLVEATTGTLFVLIFLKVAPDYFSVVFYLMLFSLLLASAVIDLKTGLLPDILTLPTILVAVPYLLISSFGIRYLTFFQASYIIVRHLLTALGTGLFFYLIVKLTRGRGMGGGDVKLAFLMGLVLGFPKIVIALYAAFLTGAVVSLILVVLGKKKFGQTIPFGPFLVLGIYLAFFLDQVLLEFFR